MRPSTRLAGAAIALLLAAVGCDDSQETLEKARQQIDLLTAERDGLKAQLAQAVLRVSNIQQRVAELETAAADASRSTIATTKKSRKREMKATFAGNTRTSPRQRR
jgi:chromosome segregation ATPase